MWFWRAELSGRAHADGDAAMGTAGSPVTASFAAHTLDDRVDVAEGEVREELWGVVEDGDDLTSVLAVYYGGERVYAQSVFCPFGAVDVGSLMLVLTEPEWIEDGDLLGEI